MNILLKPIVTEKISDQNEEGVYGFIVKKEANKIQIKKEIKKIYGVDPISVNTMIYPGKLKRRNTKSKVIEGKTSSYKKALVKVKKDEIIDVYSTID